METNLGERLKYKVGDIFKYTNANDDSRLIISEFLNCEYNVLICLKTCSIEQLISENTFGYWIENNRIVYVGNLFEI